MLLPLTNRLRLIERERRRVDASVSRRAGARLGSVAYGDGKSFCNTSTTNATRPCFCNVEINGISMVLSTYSASELLDLIDEACFRRLFPVLVSMKFLDTEA